MEDARGATGLCGDSGTKRGFSIWKYRSTAVPLTRLKVGTGALVKGYVRALYLCRLVTLHLILTCSSVSVMLTWSPSS